MAPRPTGRRRTTGSAGPTLPIALPAPSALPGRIRPERAVPCSSPFDSPEWRFSVDWDGVRALLFAGRDGIRVQGERLQDLTPLIPEIAAVAGALPPGRDAVLDGIVAVLDPEGKPDLGALAQRLCGGPRVAPAVYLATDLLHVDGAPTMAWSLDRRLELLHELVEPDAHLQVPDWVRADGHAFYDAAEERGLSAVIARRGESRYHAGVASPDRLRIAIEERADVVVSGVEASESSGRHVRVHLAEHVDGHLVAVGRAEATWPDTVTAWLRARIHDLRVSDPPCEPACAPDTDVTWLRPQLTATVRHGGWAGDTLRFPVAVALREDLDPAACVRRDPVPPPHDHPSPGGFRPTVLSTLPFADPR